MKKIFLLSLLSISVYFMVLAITFDNDLNKNDISKSNVESKIDKRTRTDLAIAQNFEMTKDPNTNSIPRERLWKAIDYAKSLTLRKEKASISNIVWRERGPNNVGGRTRAIMFDPNNSDKKRVFAAGVSGGLWVTDDIYSLNVGWTSIDNFFDNLAITTLAYNPTHNDTMYFGTGEGFGNADAVRGDGIWRSLDGGSTWSQLANSTSFTYVQKIVVDYNGNVYAATYGGLQKSTDNGNTWSAVLSTSIPATGTKSTSNRVSDVELSKNGDLYVSIGLGTSDGIYKSTNAGTSWTKVYSSSGEHRIELACAPSDNDYVYGITQNSVNDSAKYIIASSDGGSSWAQNTPPKDINNKNFTKKQAWYNLSIAIDPTDETTLVIGAIDLYKSSNSASSFSEISHWYGGGGYPEVHSDQHIAIFAPNSSDTILFGNDGGVYLSENFEDASPSFKHQVASYNTVQFYACAIHPTKSSNHFLAGSQDNGSHKFSNYGINATTEVTGGDGAFVHIDQDNANYQFTSYVYNQYRRSTNGGTSFSSINFSSSKGKFINPTDYDNDAQILYCSWDDGKFMRWTDPRSGGSYGTVTFSASGTGEPSAIACDPNTSNRIYIGTDDAEVWRINDASGTPIVSKISTASMPSSGYVSCIAVEDGDEDHLLVTYSNYGVNSVWETTDGGTNWTSVEGNLPDMPIRWAMFSPIGGDSALLATELGVWSTTNLNGTSTNWAVSNTGLANVRTDMLQFRESDSTVIAATHGRGLYSYSFTKIIETEFVVSDSLSYPGDELTFTDVSTGATSWAWDFDNDGNTDATSQNPSWTYYTGGLKTVKLTINGSLSETKTNYIQVLPKLGTPYSTSDGGNFESNLWHFGSNAINGSINKWEVGSPSNHISNTSSGSNVWKTDLDANLAEDNYQCAVYSPSFNFANDGTYTLSFKYRMEVEYSNAPFGVFVEYSINGGNSWSQLGTYNATKNWYSTSSHSVVSSGDAWSNIKSSYTTATQDVSTLKGNSDVRFRIVLQMQSGWSADYDADGFAFDDFTISGPTNNENAWGIESTATTAIQYLGPNQTKNFVSSDNEIIARIENLSSHNFGLTTVSIDNAGTGTQNFGTNTASGKQIMDKTILITPTTNNTSASVKISTYFLSTEASNWKTNTSNYLKYINQVKSTGSISSATTANTIYGTSTSVDSAYNGSALCITSTYSNGFSGLGAGLGGNSGPLPVHLISFEGQRLSSSTILTWSTAMELNSSHFEVERLQGNEFSNIGSVSSKTNSNSLTKYTFTDNDLIANSQLTNSYRLKMVDLDGSYTHSKIISLAKKEDSRNITIYPNPVRNTLNINVNSRAILPFSVTIYNIKGELVQTAFEIENSSKLNIDKLKNGIYFVSIIRDNKEIETSKIYILR